MDHSSNAKFKKLESILAIVTKVATKFSIYNAAFMGSFDALDQS